MIDYTEALVSIDINSGARDARRRHRDDRAQHEPRGRGRDRAAAAHLRDVGGLIVIDFIDMESQKNQRASRTGCATPCSMDRARIQIGRISRFGLLEMSRQRLRPSLGESTQHRLPALQRHGHRSAASSRWRLPILRLIGEEARKDRTDAGHRAAAGRRRDLPHEREARLAAPARDAQRRSTSCSCPTRTCRRRTIRSGACVTTRWRCRKTLRRATRWQARAWSELDFQTQRRQAPCPRHLPR